MRILICGDRNWADRLSIRRYLDTLDLDTIIIAGGARGADTIAEEEAEVIGLTVHVFPAEWDKYGRAAGPIRNQQMLDEGLPDLVVYFHPNLSASRGTADMCRRARKRNIPVVNGDSGDPYFTPSHIVPKT